MPRPAPSLDLLRRELLRGSRPFILFQNILTYYVDLPAFLIPVGDEKNWQTLVTRRLPMETPMDFENFDQWEERVRYNGRCLAKAFSTGKPLCLPHHGLHGLFVPVLKSGRCLAVLQTGVFLRDVPSEAELLALWKGLSGRKPLPNDDAFLAYARSVSSCPVLDAQVVAGLIELFEVFAAFLTGSLDGEAAAARMEALQRDVFARRLWHRQWVEWQAITPKFFRFNGDPKKLMPWEVEELGIRRFPTTVLAAKREGTGREWADALAALAFQREARSAARDLGETITHPLGHYGVLLLSSADPSASPAQAQAELSARAAAFAERMGRRFGCRVWVGIGGTDPSGTALRDSYHQAVAALHLALARDQTVIRYRDLEPASLGGAGLRREVEALARILLDEGRGEAGRHAGAFVQDVLLKTLGRPEASRRAFMELLNRLLGALETRRGLEPEDLERFEQDVSFRMETAHDLNEMVARFESSLNLLLSFLDRPVSGDKYFRLAKASQAVEASLHEPWTLPQAAKQFGFSPTTFSREFTRHAGLPFSDFLINKRIEKAKRLLTEERSLEQVAEACGFRTVNYFIQIFKRKVGVPPGKFGRSKSA